MGTRVVATDEAMEPGFRAGVALGFAANDFWDGLGFSIAAGYELGVLGGAYPMGNRLGMRVDFAPIDEDYGIFLHVGVEYRASLQRGRFCGYVGLGLGYSYYDDGFEDASEDSSGPGAQVNLGVDAIVLGPYAIGAYGQVHFLEESQSFGLAITRY